jgi:hypothetical protein
MAIEEDDARARSIVPEDAGSALELILTSGDRVRVPGDVGLDTLRRVVQALRTAC